jgi:hypothetical protein
LGTDDGPGSPNQNIEAPKALLWALGHFMKPEEEREVCTFVRRFIDEKNPRDKQRTGRFASNTSIRRAPL